MTDVIPNLPDLYRPNEGDKFPSSLIGSEVVGFGTTTKRVEGGGLVIDYRPAGSQDVKRLHLAFNELGMWIARQ